MTEQKFFLYVEDDAMSREVMRFMLEDDLGHQLVMFADSHDFVERLHALPQKPDMIFLDIHVPPLNGFEMLNLIRQDKDYKTIKVIALTASVMNEEVEQLRTAGFDSCISKPIKFELFPSVLEQLLAGAAIWRIA